MPRGGATVSIETWGWRQRGGSLDPTLQGCAKSSDGPHVQRDVERRRRKMGQHLRRDLFESEYRPHVKEVNAGLSCSPCVGPAASAEPTTGHVSPFAAARAAVRMSLYTM